MARARSVGDAAAEEPGETMGRGPRGLSLARMPASSKPLTDRQRNQPWSAVASKLSMACPSACTVQRLNTAAWGCRPAVCRWIPSAGGWPVVGPEGRKIDIDGVVAFDDVVLRFAARSLLLLSNRICM
jgi:hypothetical protein